MSRIQSKNIIHKLLQSIRKRFRQRNFLFKYLFNVGFRYITNTTRVSEKLSTMRSAVIFSGAPTNIICNENCDRRNSFGIEE